MNDASTTTFHAPVATASNPLAESEDAPVLFLHGVSRTYSQGSAALEVLKNAELALWPGQSVALVAPSGAGKSTLLHLAGLLEHPDAGEVRGLGRKEANRRALELLAYLGLRNRATHRPSELSGGEQQRVAIARAVANAPRILLADEPTGNLDPQTADHVFRALTQLVRASGLAMLCATHNMEIAGRMDRRVTLRNGLVVES